MGEEYNLVEVLAFLLKEEVEEVSPFIVEKSFDAGEKCFVPGRNSGGVYFLLNGKLAVLIETGFENRKQVVALLESGAVVSEAGLLEHQKHHNSVVAVEKSELVYLSHENFLVIEERYPHIAIKILKKLLRVTHLRLVEGSKRLAHVL